MSYSSKSQFKDRKEKHIIMELIIGIVGTAFAIFFTAFIFIKSFVDDKKQKKVMTEIFRKYGVKTNARILSFKENTTYGRHGIKGKYNYFISFRYNSTKIGTFTCSYTLPTNNPKSKNYSDEIPIVYIPAYMDYYNELISRKEFFNFIGHKLNLGYDLWLVIFADDIKYFTNLADF